MSHKSYFIVKAIGNYSARNSDELSLEPRDVLQVIRKIDKYWYLGIRNDERGKFPLSKVVEVDVQHELGKNSIGVYVALSTFRKQQDGDLALNRNDIIIATRQVDDQWLEGKLLNLPGVGVFPSNYVWKLKDNPDDLRNPNSRSPISGLTYATVLFDMDAQLDDELDLKKDETVIIYGDHDSMYYRGETLNGRKGIFPKSFVSIIKNTCTTGQQPVGQQSHGQQSHGQQPSGHQSHGHQSHGHQSHSAQPAGRWSENYEVDNLPSYHEATSPWYNNLATDIPSYGRTLYPFRAENSNEISFEENQIVNLIKYIDENWIEIELDNRIGLAPKNYIEIIVDCSNAGSFNRDSYCGDIEENEMDGGNVEIEEYPPNTWARVLFDFQAQMNGDLNLKEGQTIRLLRKFNNDWVEAYANELDLGICPLNHVQILPAHEAAKLAPVVPRFDGRTPDNLIEFSPEKKDVPGDSNQFNRTPHQVNYDVLHELENDYQLTVFKDAEAKESSRASTRNSPRDSDRDSGRESGRESVRDPFRTDLYESFGSHSGSHSGSQFDGQSGSQFGSHTGGQFDGQSGSHSSSQPGSQFHENKFHNLNNSNSFTQNDPETNYARKNDFRKDASFDNPNYSSGSGNIYENLNASEGPAEQPPRLPRNHSDSNQYGNSTPSNQHHGNSTPSTQHHSNSHNETSFLNELNRSISSKRFRPVPETPKRPVLPPTPSHHTESNQYESRHNESIKSANESSRSVYEPRREVPYREPYKEPHKEPHKESYKEAHKETAYKDPHKETPYKELHKESHKERHIKTPEITRSYVNKNYSGGNEGALNTSGHSTDLQSTTEGSSKLTNNRLAKMAEQRACIITELIQSEKDYRYALEALSNTFLRNEKFTSVLNERNVDLKLIFSNLDEIIEVSRKLNERLIVEQSKEPASQEIGRCFLDLEREMSEAYGVYCRNHDDVVPAFSKYEQDPEINRFFQRGLDQIRSKTNCFDIPSVLIKPVQRLLKFPLMLNELIKCTPNECADYEHLQSALRMITDMARNINEFKKRNYIVCKYRKEAERSNSFSSRLSKLNLHTIKKKYSRFNYGLKSTIGLGSKNTDQQFQAELDKFRSLEKSIKTFLKNVAFLVEQLDVYVRTTFALSEEMVALYGDKCKQRLIEKARSCHYEILNRSIGELKNKIEIYISDTLKRLLEKFANPEILIKKRKDKSIDLECAINRYQAQREGARAKASKDELDTAREVYEALNQQLLQDLPMFTSFGIEIFTNCIVAFITFYKKFIGNIVKQMIELLQLPPIEGSKINCSNDIVETFQVKHNLIAKKLVEDFHIVPNNIFPQVMNSQTLASAALDKHKLMKNSKLLNTAKNKTNYQTKENRLAILSNSKIDRSQIYIVKESFEPNDVLDLFAQKEDIVVVIKRKDPTGLSNRWFVDNGNQKGFLPASLLVRYDPGATAPADSFSLASNPSSSGYQSGGFQSGAYSYGQTSGPTFGNLSTHGYSDWSASNAIYSEIGEPSGGTSESRILDDFDPIKQQQAFESINAQLDKGDDVNLNRKEPPVNEYFIATFDFQPNGVKQLSLKQGEIVVVKYKCDLHKNDEWWYIQNTENKCGYVPASYLSPS